MIVGDPDDKNKKAEKQLSAEDFAKLPYSEKIRLRAMAKAEA
jgi:Cdc6-like AAA superfamily ATPase